MNPTLSTARRDEIDAIELLDDPARAIPIPVPDAGDTALETARLVWMHRALLRNALLVGLAAGAMVALLIPSRYESTVQLMPPDSQSNSGIAMLAALSAKAGGGMGAFAGDVLGIKSSGITFHWHTAQPNRRRPSGGPFPAQEGVWRQAR